MKRFVFALVLFVNTLVWAVVSVAAARSGHGAELWLRAWDAVTWGLLLLAVLLWNGGMTVTFTKSKEEVE